MTSDTNQPNDLWWTRGKFYSLYIDKFANDIPGLVAKLPYFTELGINCLHLLPHYPSPMRDGGYDISDYTGVRPELGTVEDFKRLCTEAHQQGVRIMVDLVLNHTSSDHPWFVESRSSKDNPKRNFYMWSDTGTEYPEAPNVFPDFKDNNWIWNEATEDYYFTTFKPSQPDLNWQNDAVRDAMFEVVDTLVGYGVDGFRLDAIVHLAEKEGTNSIGTPETHARIRELRAYLDEKHPHVILLAEALGKTEDSKAYFGNGDECHLTYNQEFMAEILYAVRTGNRGERIKAILEENELPTPAAWMSYLRNHDSVSIGTLGEERYEELLDLLDPERAHMFGHNNGEDTVQRLFNLYDKDPAHIRKAFTLLYALPTATVMYYGDEIGMENSPLPPGENDMRYTVRGQFDWEEAERQMADPNSLFNYVKKCIQDNR